MADFNDKVVIVTGSSSGIGAATARLFAQHGAKLTIVGRNESRLLQVAKDCQDANGHKPLCLLLDLTQNNACDEVVRKTIETYKKLDVLINCAGKVALTSVFDDNLDGFDELIALNLRVPYKLSQLCIPYLKKTKGSIVNVFGAPMKVIPGLLVNSMIRDALERFTKSGGRELASEGVRMNAVRPGFTRTNILNNLNIEDKYFDKTYANISKKVPSNVIIEPSEVAQMILFAASDTCPNLNASSLVIDSAVSSL